MVQTVQQVQTTGSFLQHLQLLLYSHLNGIRVTDPEESITDIVLMHSVLKPGSFPKTPTATTSHLNGIRVTDPEESITDA